MSKGKDADTSSLEQRGSAESGKINVLVKHALTSN